jgi:hypothetical protein
MTPYLDPALLTSIGGIVTLTILFVQVLKRALADVTALKDVPTAAYGLVVSVLLTFVAHRAHWLEGELVELVFLAVLNTLIAFGVLTAPSWKKPIGESTDAQAARDRARFTSKGLALLLAAVVGLSTAACASTGKTLVRINDAAYTAITITDDNAEHVCAAKLAPAAACASFNTRMLTVMDAYQAFNRGVASNDASELPALAHALRGLVTSIEELITDETLRASLRERLESVLALVQRVRGQ